MVPSGYTVYPEGIGVSGPIEPLYVTGTEMAWVSLSDLHDSSTSWSP